MPKRAMSEHTPEPWEADSGLSGAGWLRGRDGEALAHVCVCKDCAGGRPEEERLANARRIVACVNACEGIRYAPDALIWECEAAIAEAEGR